ncbi:MAG: hypothetical protein ACLQLG_08215 [Thermoguttaceae bacterium]
MTAIALRAAFVAVFVLSLALVAWMIFQVAKLPAEGNTQRVS